MMNIKIICVGKLKENYFSEAAQEYIKRLSPLCRLETEQLPEVRLSASPGEAEIEAALKKEAESIQLRIPAGAMDIAMCVEGKKLDSEKFSRLLELCAQRGRSKLCFIIGGSYGLHDSIKDSAAIKLSMSDMTFPHHLARIMLLEQLYRAFKISEGSKYHK